MTSQPQPDDCELVRSAQQGKMEAFALLYQRYLPIVYNRVRYLVPTEDVEDVTQEVFIAVIRSLCRFRGESKFSTWLRTLTNRQIADYYRKRSKPESELDERFSAPENPSASEEAIALRQAFQKLPKKYKEVILLRFTDQVRFSEIARLNGQSLEATKSLFRRAVAALNKQVKVNG